MSNNQGALYNLFWKFAERTSAQLISTVVSIVLARLLGPSEYGTISIVMIFIAIANVFVSDGFGSALIQKKDTKAIDYFSVLYFNIAFSIILYVVLFLCAPFIARFFGEGYEILIPVLRVLGVRIVLTAVNSVQQAYISKKMMFRKFFVATLWGTIISAVIGIAMAYTGYGVWALVAQYLVSAFVSTFTLFVSLRKRPQFVFSFKSLKELFPFGARILGTGLLINGYVEMQALIIGKVYSSSDLAYYDKGRQFPNLIVTNINTSIGAILFPKMAQMQDDRAQIKAIARKSIRFSAYIMCPLMLGLAAIAEPFVRILLTDKWLPCVPLLQLFCIFYLFQPVHTANLQAIKAIGRGDVYIKLEIVKKIIELAVLLIVMRYSVNAIVAGMAACTTLFVFVNAFPNIKLLNYKFREQIKDMFPSLGMSIVMFIVVYLIGYIPMNSLLLLCAQIAIGGVVYILLSVLTRNKELKYIFNMFKNTLKKRKGKDDFLKE